MQLVLSSGIMPRLVALLGSTDTSVLFEAAWAITNIASTEYTRAVVDSGAVPYLVKGMMCSAPNVREQCMWCLGNIAGDCVAYRDLLLLKTPGAVPALLMNIRNPASPGLLSNAAWTLSNFCRGKPSPPPDAVRGMVPALAYLLTHPDKDVLTHAAWGLANLSDGDERTVQILLDAGITPRCVELLRSGELTVVMPALRIVGNFISGTHDQTQKAIECGCLKALVPLLSHEKRNVRREACWAVSNVAAGTTEQITALMMVPGLMNAVVSQLRGADWNVKKEAAWAVSNIAATGKPEHVQQLIAMDVIPPLVDILRTNDARMLLVVLDAVSAVLDAGVKLARYGCRFNELFEENGLLDYLEDLQDHESDDVSRKAGTILETHFEIDAEPESAPVAAPAAAPAAASSTTSFGFDTTGFGSSMSSAPTPFGMSATSNTVSMMTPPTKGFGFGTAAVPAPAAAAPPAFSWNNMSFV